MVQVATKFGVKKKNPTLSTSQTFNALDEAAKKYTAGTLSEENKNTLLDTTKANIASAGGDRAAGIKNTQDLLKNTTLTQTKFTNTQPDVPFTEKKGLVDKTKIEAPATTGATTGITPATTGTTTGASTLGLDEGVKAGKYTLTSSGDYLDSVTGKLVGTKTGGMIGGTTPATTGGDFATQSEATKKEVLYTDEKGNQFTYGDVLNALTPEQQKYYNDLALKGADVFKKGLEDALQTVQGVKENVEFLKSQQDKRTNIQNIQTQMQNINIEAENQKAYNDLQTLKQNIGFLGYGLGQPGVSDQKITALQNQIKDGEATYGRIVELNRLTKEARAQGIEIDEAAFRKQIGDMEKSLKLGVDKAIQNAINDINAMEIQGILDDPEKFNQVSKQILASMDKEISGLSDTAFAQKKFVLDSFNKLVDEKQDYLSKINTVNKDLSAAKGYYVNELGNPIQNEFGQNIMIPEKSAIEPVFDKEKGIFYTFTKNDKGEIVANAQKLFTEEGMDENAVGGYVQALQDGDLSIGDFLSAVKDEKIRNKVLAQYNAGSGAGVGTSTGFEGSIPSTGGIDFSTNQEIQDKYPLEAAFKNNNPTGITWNKNFEAGGSLAKLLDAAGVNFTMGKARPKDEGGNYVKFATVDDGMKAYATILTKASYDDVYDRLKQWVGGDDAKKTAYANDLMTKAGIQKGEKFSTLDDARLEKLMAAQLERESPNFYKELTGGQTGTSEVTTTFIDGLSDYQKKVLQQYDGKDIAKLASNLGVNEKKARNIYNQYLSQFSGLDPEGIAFQITSILPRDMYKTDADMNRVVGAVRDGILALKKQGKEPTQENVSDYIRGFTLNDTADKGFSDNAREVLNMNAKNTDRNDWKTVANYINKGDYDNADKYISNFVEKVAKDHFGEDFVSKTNVNILQKNITKLRELINKNPDKIGAFDGRVTEFMKKFKDYPEMQELQTLLTINQADIRKYFAGSAVSSGEMEALKNYIGGDIKMTPVNLLTQLETILGTQRNQMIEQRKNFGYTPRERDRSGKLIVSPTDESEIDNIFNQ